MCRECGCGIVGEVGIGGQPGRSVDSPLLNHPHAGEHSHHDDEHHHHHGGGADHEHEHPHPHGDPHHAHEQQREHGHQTVTIQHSLLDKNDRLAERNRGFFRAKKLLVLNVLSSPGSGKTTFIQKTAEALRAVCGSAVIVGDLATDNDAARLRAGRHPGGADHHRHRLPSGSRHGGPSRRADSTSIRLDVLVIENVGNLVCPADYDLGEDLRVVLLSVTEGEDKPLKYPPMFHSAHVAVVTKSDLAAAAGFDRDQALANLQRISHHARVFELSARTGQGMDAWLAFLIEQHAARAH